MLHTAIGIASLYMILLVDIKYTTAERFVAKFITFDDAEADRKLKPNMPINTKIRKLPVPGPKNPS